MSIPMGINDFVETTICLLICFSICAKMQGFIDKYVFFDVLRRYPAGKKICRNHYLSPFLR